MWRTRELSPAQHHGRGEDAMVPIRVETAAMHALRAGGDLPPTTPVIGAAVPSPDGTLHEVTFVWTPDAGDDRCDAMVHITSITDGHRTDVDPARFEQVAPHVFAVGYLLPDDLVLSYRIVTLPTIRRDAGATRSGWLDIHAAGKPDPRNPEQLASAYGATSSVLRMPASRRHPAEFAATPPLRVMRSVSLPARGDAAALEPITALVPDTPADRALVVFDAEQWRRMPLADDLARHPLGGVVALLIPSGPCERRSRVLPDPSGATQAVADALERAQSAGILPTHLTADEVTVAGQSYGGLAAAGVVMAGLARRAIVQSGSFQYRADIAQQEQGTATGDHIEQLAGRTLPYARVAVQYGSLEGMLGRVGRAFADAARTAGIRVAERVYAGGHDFAWWRTGLLDGLDQLDELDRLLAITS